MRTPSEICPPVWWAVVDVISYINGTRSVPGQCSTAVTDFASATMFMGRALIVFTDLFYDVTLIVKLAPKICTASRVIFGVTAVYKRMTRNAHSHSIDTV